VLIDPPLSVGERLEARVVRALGRLSPSAQLRLSGGTVVRVDGQELDPGIQLTLAAALRFRGGASMRGSAGPDATVAEVRSASRRDALALTARPTAVERVNELQVTGAAGLLRARHYVPPEWGGRPPLLVFLHGGGWTIGDLDTHDEPCRILCRHGGAHVLSIEYRLAPEHPFPAAVEDAKAALDWAFAHAAELGADPVRVAIGGDSAGGNLAAVATQASARAGGRIPALQVLIYPGTDFTQRRASTELFAEGFFLTEQDRMWCQSNYLDGTDADPGDSRASPLLAPDLSRLSPAIVATAAFDPLRDEGEAYAHALKAAGTPAVLRRFPGLIHGFINMTAINRAAHDATLEIAAMTRAALALTA
jgi:acetyl esterase